MFLSLAQLASDIGDVIGHLVPYIIVILIGGLGLAKKVFEGYLEKERKRATQEGRPPSSPFESLRDFLESLEGKAKPGRPGRSRDRPAVEGIPTPPVQPAKVEIPISAAVRTRAPVSASIREHGRDLTRRRQAKTLGRRRKRKARVDPHYRLLGDRHSSLLRGGPRALRQAIVWREILGPPVALRQSLPGSGDETSGPA